MVLLCISRNGKLSKAAELSGCLWCRKSERIWFAFSIAEQPKHAVFKPRERIQKSVRACTIGNAKRLRNSLYNFYHLMVTCSATCAIVTWLPACKCQYFWQILYQNRKRQNFSWFSILRGGLFLLENQGSIKFVDFTRIGGNFVHIWEKDTELNLKLHLRRTRCHKGHVCMHQETNAQHFLHLAAHLISIRSVTWRRNFSVKEVEEDESFELHAVWEHHHKSLVLHSWSF